MAWQATFVILRLFFENELPVLWSDESILCSGAGFVVFNLL